MTRTSQFLSIVILSMLMGQCCVAAMDKQASALDIRRASGIQGGLVVHMGSGDDLATTDFAAHDRTLVHGLYDTRDRVHKVRESVKQKNQYGKVSVQYWDKDYLPYADNMVNLLVAEELGDIPMDEVMRVLTPLGAAFIKSHATWTKKNKPWPEQIDEWTHYLHDANNNAVAHDMVVGLPRPGLYFHLG